MALAALTDTSPSGFHSRQIGGIMRRSRLAKGLHGEPRQRKAGPTAAAATGRGMTDDGDAKWRDNLQNAWAALRMIREAVETLGPPGILMSEEQFLPSTAPSRPMRQPRL